MAQPVPTEEEHVPSTDETQPDPEQRTRAQREAVRLPRAASAERGYALSTPTGTTRLSAGAWSTLPSASHLGIILLRPGAVKTDLSAGQLHAAGQHYCCAQ